MKMKARKEALSPVPDIRAAQHKLRLISVALIVQGEEGGTPPMAKK